MVKASALIVQLAVLIAIHGDREILATADGFTISLPDDYTLFSAGWADEQYDAEPPFRLELEDLIPTHSSE